MARLRAVSPLSDRGRHEAASDHSDRGRSVAPSASNQHQSRNRRRKTPLCCSTSNLKVTHRLFDGINMVDWPI